MIDPDVKLKLENKEQAKMSRSEYAKAWRAKNKEKVREASKRWRKKNKEKSAKIVADWRRRNKTKYKEMRKKYSKTENSLKKSRTYQKNFRSKMIGDSVYWSKRRASTIKARCKKIGIPCTIESTDLLSLLPVDLICPVLGTKMKLHGKLSHASATIDRIIPSDGYVPGNICIISHKANTIKNNVTNYEEIMRVAEWMRLVIK